MNELIAVLRVCDSWSNVEEHIREKHPAPQFGVTIFFDSKNDADRFDKAVQLALNGS